MKTRCFLMLLAVSTLCLPVGCVKKPVQPSQLFAYVGSDPVGGPMRVSPERNLPRNPPRLPQIIDKSEELAQAKENPQPPPPPFDDMQVTAAPQVTSPVPQDADAFFEGNPPQTSALGALFQSIFQPPNPQPTATGSATYRVVP